MYRTRWLLDPFLMRIFGIVLKSLTVFTHTVEISHPTHILMMIQTKFDKPSNDATLYISWRVSIIELINVQGCIFHYSIVLLNIVVCCSLDIGGTEEICSSRKLAAGVHDGTYTDTAEERDGSFTQP